MLNTGITEATLEAEECLIGSILIESATYGTRQSIIQAVEYVSPLDFYSEQHRVIFEAMIKCPKPPHIINTAMQMQSEGTLTPKLPAHLRHCISVVPCSLDYLDYARAVKQYSDSRQGKATRTIKGAL